MPRLIDLILTQARKQNAEPAFVYDPGAGFVEVSYSAFARQACAVAKQLHKLGCRPGDKVVLLADNSPRWCAAYVGIHGAGMTLVPLDAGYT